MAVSAYDTRLARRTAKAQAEGEAAGGGRATDEAVKQAYEMGLAGEKLGFAPEDDPRLREAHRMGLDERARDRRRTHAREIAGKSSSYLGRLGSSTRSRLGEVPTSSGGGSFVGVMVGMLLVIGLFLLLNRSNLAANTITGVVHGVTWLVRPSVLPF